MSEVQGPNCGGDKTTIQRQRGWGLLMLALGLLLFSAGPIKLQAWFPSDSFWHDFIMSGTLSMPDYYSGWDFLKYSLSFAVISSLGLFLAGFGIWLMATSVLECKDCGYKE